MSKEDFKTFDIKLTDGKYFKNIKIASDDNLLEDKEEILDYQYTNDAGSSVNMEMQIYHKDDEEYTNCLAYLYSNDIEYLCNSYKDREVK